MEDKVTKTIIDEKDKVTTIVKKELANGQFTSSKMEITKDETTLQML